MNSKRRVDLTNVIVNNQQDVVRARQRARLLAELLKFEKNEQTKIATAVSEIARNAFEYGLGGRVGFAIVGADGFTKLIIEIRDHGKGIKNIEDIFNGTYVSSTGLGVGILGAKRLMDHFIVETGENGTCVILEKRIPSLVELTTKFLQEITRVLSQPQSTSDNAYVALNQQNQELVSLLDELQNEKKELEHTNKELEATNRGVVALYAEIDEKAEFLKKASEEKSRFLSHISHEFRTPLNSIISLSNFLMERLDGELTSEQAKQVTYIRKSATDLIEIVNDLLDLAKVESGKCVIRVSRFSARDLFDSLKGVLRPLKKQNVQLRFIVPDEQFWFETDEGKVAQILRNLIGNALKFTEAGTIQVEVSFSANGHALFVVQDSGIGIPFAEIDRIFEEFVELDSGLLKPTKGTGLGLPLSRKLSRLLGGELYVESVLGEGSTFSAEIPFSYKNDVQAFDAASDEHFLKILVVDDEEVARYIFRSHLNNSIYKIFEGASGEEGLSMALSLSFDAIVIDLNMPGGIDGFDLLGQLRKHEKTKNLPIIVQTSSLIDENVHRRIGGLADAVFSKRDVNRDTLMNFFGKLGKHSNTVKESENG